MKKFIIGAALTGMLLPLSACESWERTKKSVSSDFKGGLNRTVQVYSQDGELIKEYRGKLDVQVNEYGNKVLFDLNGKRVTINNAIVITEEK